MIISLLKKSITETKEITLPYYNSVISFEFASLNYTYRDRNNTAYILEGFDKTWNYVGSKRTATYTNLDAGEYVFKVRGSIMKQMVSGNNVHQADHHTPFWQTGGSAGSRANGRRCMDKPLSASYQSHQGASKKVGAARAGADGTVGPRHGR